MRRLLSLILILILSTSVAISDVSVGSWYVVLEVTEEIQKLSDEICKNCKTDLEKIKSIYRWVYKKTQNMLTIGLNYWKAMENGELIIIDPTEIIEKHGLTICTGRSAVCVVLLRAQNINAKLAIPTNHKGHMVAAIYIDDKIYKADFSFEESLVEVEETSFDTIYEDNVY